MRHKVCPRYAFRHWQSFTLLLCYLGSLALQSEQYSMAYLTKRSDCSLKDTCVPIAPLNYQPLLSQYTPGEATPLLVTQPNQGFAHWPVFQNDYVSFGMFRSTLSILHHPDKSGCWVTSFSTKRFDVLDYSPFGQLFIKCGRPENHHSF
jgi:hypothetical protein